MRGQNQIRGLIFDCDGVLFDSKDANTAYYNHILTAAGLPPLTETQAAWAHMVSTDEVMRHLVPEDRREAAVEARRTMRYREHFMPLMRPEPGMADFLRAAHRAGLPLAMCTNRSDSVHEVLRHFGLAEFFLPVMTISNARPKPDPDGLLQILGAWSAAPDAVAFVGDSLVDQQASRAAGVPFWSFANPDLDALLHIDSFARISTMLRF